MNLYPESVILDDWRKLKAGERIVMSCQGYDALVDYFHVHDGDDATEFFRNVCSIYNPNQLGTKDEYVVWLVSHPNGPKHRDELLEQVCLRVLDRDGITEDEFRKRIGRSRTAVEWSDLKAALGRLRKKDLIRVHFDPRTNKTTCFRI